MTDIGFVGFLSVLDFVQKLTGRLSRILVSFSVGIGFGLIVSINQLLPQNYRDRATYAIAELPNLFVMVFTGSLRKEPNTLLVEVRSAIK